MSIKLNFHNKIVFGGDVGQSGLRYFKQKKQKVKTYRPRKKNTLLQKTIDLKKPPDYEDDDNIYYCKMCNQHMKRTSKWEHDSSLKHQHCEELYLHKLKESNTHIIININNK